MDVEMVEGSEALDAVMEDLAESVYSLQVELQRLNHNLNKVQRHQAIVADVCGTLKKWSEISPFFQEKLKKHLKNLEPSLAQMKAPDPRAAGDAPAD